MAGALVLGFTVERIHPLPLLRQHLVHFKAVRTSSVFSLECSGSLTLSLEVSVAEEGQFVQLRAAELIAGRTLETTPYRRRILSAAAEETFRRRLANGAVKAR